MSSANQGLWAEREHQVKEERSIKKGAGFTLLPLLSHRVI